MPLQGIENKVQSTARVVHRAGRADRASGLPSYRIGKCTAYREFDIDGYADLGPHRLCTPRALGCVWSHNSRIMSDQISPP